MTLLDSLKYPASRKVGVVDLTGGVPLRQWTQSGGTDAWYADVTGLFISGVVQDGVTQTEQNSIGNVSTSGGWYWDTSTERLYVKLPYDSTLVQAIAVWHIATHAKDFDSEDFNRSSRLTGVPTIKLAIASSFGGTKKTSGGSIDVVNNDAIFDDFPKVNFDAGTVSFYVAVDVLR